MKRKTIYEMKKREKILKVIKLIRDSFHESVATYTCGRCYHFAKILREVFGGDIYHFSDNSHCFTKIDNHYYDIYGDTEKKYHEEDFSKVTKLTKEEEWAWDSNFHSGTVELFQKNYIED